MEIVDAQIHMPDPGRLWEFESHTRYPMLCELACEAMDAVGVDAALVTQLPGSRTTSGDSTEGGGECHAFASRYPDRFAGVILVNHRRPDIREFVRTVCAGTGILALRITIRNSADDVLYADFREGKYEPLFEAAEEYQVPIFVSASNHLCELVSVAQAHPDLCLILDQLGLGLGYLLPRPIDYDPWGRIDEVMALSRFPSVAAKISRLEEFTNDDYPYRDAWPHLRRLVDSFGPERLMWGSDFTRLRFIREDAVYSRAIGYIRDTDWLSTEEKELILGGTVRRLLRWKRPESPYSRVDSYTVLPPYGHAIDGGW